MLKDIYFGVQIALLILAGCVTSDKCYHGELRGIAEERKREYDRLFDAYSLACDEFTRLEGNLIMYKPETATEPFKELYCEAVHRLPYQHYKCEMLQFALQNHNGRG